MMKHKICPSCGDYNAISAIECEKCGVDLISVIPCKRKKKPACGKQYVLCELSGSYTYDIPDNGEFIIGRENTLKDVLADKAYVSRLHAKITAKNGKAYITDLNSTNGTYLDNKKNLSNKSVILNPGNEIGLGGYEADEIRPKSAAFLIVREK